jgi:hypothetical protein
MIALRRPISCGEAILVQDAQRGESVLGPYGIGNRWSSPGMNGHIRQTRIAGHTHPPFRSRPTNQHGDGFKSPLGCREASLLPA